MEHNTIGQKYAQGRVVRIVCRENPTAEELYIRTNVF